VTAPESPRTSLEAKTIGPGFATCAVLLGLFLQGSMQDVQLSIIAPGIIFMGMTLLFIAAGLAGKIAVKRTAADPFIAALVAVGALSVIAASYRRSWTIGFVNLAAFAVLYFTCTLSLSRRNARALFAAIVGAAAVAVTLGLVQDLVVFEEMVRKIQTNPKWLEENLPGISAEHAGDLLSRIKSREVFSFFILSNIFAGFLLLVLPLCAGIAVDALVRAEGARKTAAAAPALLVLAGGYLFYKTSSKGAWLVAALMLAAFAAWAAGRTVFREKRLLYSLAALVGVIALGVYLGWNHIADALAVRLGYYATALKIWRSHPIIGVGLGNFPEHYFLYKSAAAHEVKNAHSLILQALSETGILGAVAVLAAWIALGAATFPKSAQAAGQQKPPTGACITSCAFGAAAAFALGYALNVFSLYSLLGYMLAFAIAFTCVLLVPTGRATQAGLAAGFLALLLHACADFDLNVAALAIIAAVTAATGATAAGKLKTWREVRLKPAAAAALIILPVAGFIAFVFLVARPLSVAGACLAEARFTKDSAKREALLKKAVSTDPACAEGYLKLADFYSRRFVQTGDPTSLAEAEKLFAGADRLRPLSATTHNQWGRMYEERFRWMTRKRKFDKTKALGLIEAALSHYNKAIARYPTQPWHHYYAARLAEEAWRLTRRDDFAREAFEKYVRSLRLYSEAGDLRLRFDYETVRDIHKAAGVLAAHLGKPPPPLPKPRK